MSLKPKRKLLIISLSIIISLALIIGACAVYLCDYYHADEGAIAVFSSDDNVSISTLDNGTVIFEPQNATTGFIFYPGGKVDHNAYQPLMKALAKEGILCVLVEMPFRLAIFDINAAEGIQAQYPEIENWYIGGHSLGGAMAASYVSDHADKYNGLILLGSYSTADLSNSNLNILSIYGSEDKILNQEKYSDNKSNLPNDFTEIIIEGGNHAQFGNYGEQRGDGKALISAEEQQKRTVEQIIQSKPRVGRGAHE